MNVLFIGDIVGTKATAYVASCVPQLRRALGVHLVVANAENAAPSGMGMTSEQRDLLFANGVDVITGGNHSWDDAPARTALRHPRVLRPLNLPADIPGGGMLHLKVEGRDVTILSLGDPQILNPLPIVGGRAVAPYDCWVKAEPVGDVIIDFHSEYVIEKQIFAYAVDGEVSAILGTHTHEATLPLHILPRGTGLVTDVGMTGPLGGVQGFASDNFVTGLRRVGDPFAEPLPSPVEGPITLGAVLLIIEDGRTCDIERVEC